MRTVTGGQVPVERICMRADGAPTAAAAARVLLAQLCASAGWDGARLELRNEAQRQPIWHVRPRRPLPLLRAAAEERRHAISFLDEALGQTGWRRQEREGGVSFLFPVLAGARRIGALEAFARAEPRPAILELTAALCDACGPVLGR